MKINQEIKRPRVRVGMLPLADAVPFLVARELDLFAGHGLNVKLSLESSWASVRDKVAAGLLDAAQMLAPMPLAANLGADQLGVPMETALVLSRNGNSITVSNQLYEEMGASGGDRAAPALAGVLRAERKAGREPRVFAHVFPYSSHHYLLREWLSGAGIDTEQDIRLIVIPPHKVLDYLRQGRIDGYCVGAPWGKAAEDEGIGRRIVATHTIRDGCAEKVLGVTRDWATLNPLAHLSMVAALIEAGRWLEQPGHRAEAAQMLIDAKLIDVAPHSLRMALSDDGGDPMGPQFIFGSGETLSPLHSDAQWFVSQMRRWGQVSTTQAPDDLLSSSFRLKLHGQASAMATSVSPQMVQ